MLPLQKFTFFDPGPNRSDNITIIDRQGERGMKILLCHTSLDHGNITSSYFPNILPSPQFKKKILLYLAFTKYS